MSVNAQIRGGGVVEGLFGVVTAEGEGYFSAPGDSGALIVRQDGAALGIIMGRSADTTLALPIHACLDPLNCSLLY